MVEPTANQIIAYSKANPKYIQMVKGYTFASANSKTAPFACPVRQSEWANHVRGYC